MTTDAIDRFAYLTEMTVSSREDNKRSTICLPHYLLLAVIVIAVALCYGNIIQGDLQFDDEVFINPSLANLHLQSLLSLDTLKDYFHGNRIATLYTFALNYHLSGLDVAGYHLTNIIIHACNIVLSFLFLCKILGFAPAEKRPYLDAPFFALCVTAIFALHPLQTESVSYIVQRSELLAAFCYLGYLIALLNFAGGRGPSALAWWFAGMLFFLTGWGCKEIIITAPVSFLVCMLYLGDNGHLKRAWRGVAPYLIGGAALTCIKIVSLRGNMGAGFDSYKPGVLAYLLTQLKVVAGYLGLFILPYGQNIDHDVAAITNPLSMEALVYILVWLSVMIGCIYLLTGYHGRHRRCLRLIGFGIIWFLLILAPTSSIIPLPDVMFEHRVYLPLLGAGTAFVAFIDLLVGGLHRSPGRTAIMTVTWVSVALLLAGATHRRNMVWQTKLALWQDAAMKSPNKSRPHNNLGNCYFLLDRFAEAAASYQKAIRLDSRNAESYYNLALTLKNLGRDDEAFLVHRMFVNLVSGKSADSKPFSGGR